MFYYKSMNMQNQIEPTERELKIRYYTPENHKKLHIRAQRISCFQEKGFCENLNEKNRMNVDELWCKMSHFPIGGVRSKKFEQISTKICRVGEITPRPPFRPPHFSASGGEATLSDLPAGRQVERFQVFRSTFSGTLSFARFSGGHFHITFADMRSCEQSEQFG